MAAGDAADGRDDGQAALHEREYLRSVLETEPACVKLVAQDGTLLDMNAAGLAMIEAGTLDEVRGRALVDLVSPEHRDAFQRLHRQVFAGEHGSLEFAIVGLHGTHRWLETQAAPLRDQQGKITALLGVTRDITVSRHQHLALRESERLLQTLSQVVPVGIFRADAEGRATYVNRRWAELAGRPEDAAAGDGWIASVHPDDRERVVGIWHRAYETRTPASATFRIRRPDGTTLAVLATSVPEWSDAGTFLGFIGTVTDVTALERAEFMLETQRSVLEAIACGEPLTVTLTQLLRAIERDAPGLLASILLLDDDGVHVVHASAPSLSSEYIRAIDGQPIGPTAGSCGTAIYLNQPVTTEDILVDPKWDGDGYRDAAVAEGLRACWSTPIRDSQGRVLGSFAMYFRAPQAPRDEHARLIAMATHVASLAIVRHRERAALAESEERFRATFERAAIGVAHLRPDGRFVRVNPKLVEITGYSAGELQQRTPEDITHADDRAVAVAQYGRLLSGELTHYTLEKRLLRKSGEAIWVNATVSMVRRPDDRPDYAILVVEDVTAKRSLEAQLRQAQKLEAVGMLAGGVAHDFNNLLSVILGLAEMARDALPAASHLRDDMQVMLDAAERGTEITRQLLAFARQEPANPVVLDVNRHLEALKRMLVRLIGEDITLTTQLDPGAGRIRIDPTHFDQIIINLMTNASEAIGGPGAIVVQTDRTTILPGDSGHPAIAPGDYVRIAVADTGIGMDAGTQEQIFAPFFTTKPRGRGTGLGLPVVHGITEQAGGHIVVDSAPGEGATFTIYLPAAPADDRTAVKKRVPADRARLTGHETLLVVEDEPPLLGLAKRTLEGYGYTVLAASDPNEALALAAQHGERIALLLTDVVMPSMSGKDLADRITARHPHIKTLFMSGYPANVLEGRRTETPPRYIQKPFGRQTLAEHVRRALDAHE